MKWLIILFSIGSYEADNRYIAPAYAEISCHSRGYTQLAYIEAADNFQPSRLLHGELWSDEEIKAFNEWLIEQADGLASAGLGGCLYS